MKKLQQLYAERERLKGREATGVAGAMLRHQKISQVEKEIAYYELGDSISRAEIQEELAEIESLQAEIDRLTAVVTERRRILKTSVFGGHAAI
ncbi:hypothetical protein [Sporosarcina sp. 6E9]|uniref:hypothetical protein n=1 Tax=Sporosarcina sp. 6E9 TaxID=2819235 RepID=UPI001AD5ED5E|nr:hypothetical protein [Sporosarcina sp. 6E9]MBO1911632.1 hypothetical protein [Microvirga sp. 3-52]